VDPFNPTQYLPSDKSKAQTISKEFSKESIDAYTANPYYSEIWQSLISDKNKYAGFNLYALLFGESWCVYRKQHILGVLIFVSSILVDLAGIQLYVNFIDASNKGERFSLFLGVLAVFVFIRVPLGFLANLIYFNKVRSDIESIISRNLPDEYFVAQIRNAGGVNVGGFILCQGLFTIFLKITSSIF
jgi:hypothetical protein